MSLILGKYKNKRKLGKGAYGQVLLVQDQLGNQYALKLISLKSMQKEPYLLEYLQGQIQCMQAMHSPYIMKLIDSDEDEKYKYMLCEYCQGGDLLNLQAKQPGQVFSLERATQILSHVIIGLQLLHKEDYLHRDIKSQNILIKNEGGKQLFKLADFGFSKKSGEVGGTVLGTQHYMSPQIYRNDNYGFQVDMWAFGVLFYFMLNKQFPFKINPHYQIQRKQAELNKLAKNFSFKKNVEFSKKKILINCNEQTQDLFNKIFTVDPDDRMTFYQIRSHPLFKKHFPVIEEASKILYTKKFQSKIVAKNKLDSQIHKTIKPKNTTKKKQEQEDEEVNVSISTIKFKSLKFPEQKRVIENKLEELQFLYESGLQFINADFLNHPEKFNLGFNITKYYIILLRNFINQMNDKCLKQLFPNLKWQQYCSTLQFKGLVYNAKEDLSKAQAKYDIFFTQCEYLLSQIEKINPKFEASFKRQITDSDFNGAFKQSYRKSTHYTFNTLRESLKNNKKTGSTKLNYALAILVICHVFNHIFSDNDNLISIFADYLNQKNKKIQAIDYSQLRQWLTKAPANKLNQIARQIIKIYFAS